jgi:hypothetical protein
VTPRCPKHGPMRLQESFVDSRPIGGIGWEGEERFRVSVYACPAAGCDEHDERVG